MKTLRKSLAILAAAALLAGCSTSTSTSTTASTSSTSGDEVYTIGLAQIVDHPSLNTIREAMLDELEDLGYTDGDTIIVNYLLSL